MGGFLVKAGICFFHLRYDLLACSILVVAVAGPLPLLQYACSPGCSELPRVVSQAWENGGSHLIGPCHVIQVHTISGLWFRTF